MDVMSDEVGTVINEHYSSEEYVGRRVGFLAKCRARSVQFKLFDIARDDASSVFASEHEKLRVNDPCLFWQRILMLTVPI